MEEKDNGELVLDDVVQISPDELDDSQKTFLQENADNLTDEQKETFKDILEKKEEVIKLGEVEPEIRTPAQKKEEKTEEEEINPDDEQVIKKVVEKRIKPVADILQRVKDEQEVDAFLRVKPELSKYRDVIIKYVQHPAYANIPVYNIAAMVTAKDLQALGAEKEREAAKKAKDTGGDGGTQRKATSGKTDWAKASKEEFEAQKSIILGQQG